MGLLLGNFFEREDAHLNFSGGNSKILLDKISQDPPDLREVAKCLMEEAQGYKGGWDSLHGERALGLQGEGAGKDQLIHRSPLAPLKKFTCYTSVCLKKNIPQCLPQKGGRWSNPVLSYFISALYFGWPALAFTSAQQLQLSLGLLYNVLRMAWF